MTEYAFNLEITEPEAPITVSAAIALTDDDIPMVIARVTGFPESEDGARAVAEMLRDWAGSIEERLPKPRFSPTPAELSSEMVAQLGKAAVGQAPAHGEIHSFKTPERVVKNRETRAKKRFNPRKAD